MAKDDLDDSVRMLALYVQNFGPFTADRTRYWRYASHLTERCGWSVEDLNEWLLSTTAPSPRTKSLVH